MPAMAVLSRRAPSPANCGARVSDGHDRGRAASTANAVPAAAGRHAGAMTRAGTRPDLPECRAHLRRKEHRRPSSPRPAGHQGRGRRRPAAGAASRAIPRCGLHRFAERARTLAGTMRRPMCSSFPSLTDTFGNVLLEALASGVPVAAFPVPGPARRDRRQRRRRARRRTLRKAALAALRYPARKARWRIRSIRLGRMRANVP